MKERIETCARAAHEANRTYCLSIGDASQPSWEDAPGWQRESAINGVMGALGGNSPAESHASWLAEKERAGWVYGETKDPEAKTHPCMVPYDQLPPEQRAKDSIFVGVVRTVGVALGLPMAAAASQPLPVKGYTAQSTDNVALANEGKELEERVLRYLDKLNGIFDEGERRRFIALGKTNIQQGFMWAIRSIFNPQRISLPEDAHVAAGVAGDSAAAGKA